VCSKTSGSDIGERVLMIVSYIQVIYIYQVNSKYEQLKCLDAGDHTVTVGWNKYSNNLLI
jgi:hypothetical protein